MSYQPTTTSRAMAEKKGQVFEGLYPAAAVRSAAASMAGVGVRDRSPDQRESLLENIVTARATAKRISEDAALEQIGDEVVAILDYAYTRLPGWREISQGVLTVADFKKKYVHSSAAGLHVVANTVAAARAAGLSPQMVIDAMAKLPWRRDALRPAKNDRNEDVQVHEFFEGTLAVTAFDTKNAEWKAGTGGATRSTYELAINKVLGALASANPSLAALTDQETQIAVGLLAAKAGRGRPRKTPLTVV